MVGLKQRGIMADMIKPLKLKNLGQVNHYWQDGWFITTQGKVKGKLPKMHLHEITVEIEKMKSRYRFHAETQ